MAVGQYETRFCFKCGEKMEGENWRGNICRPCRSAKTREWQAKNPMRCRENYYRNRYGMQPGEFARMVDAQRNLCPICSEPLDNGRKTAIDHCHKTGKVRGVLHQKCNVALAYLGDSSVTALRAASYLYLHANDDDVDFADAIARRMPEVAP